MAVKKVIIVGGGGHARVLADLILSDSNLELVGFADDQINAGHEVLPGIKVLCQTDPKACSAYAQYFIIGIGNNEVRARLFQQFKTVLQPVVLIHEFSSVSPHAHLGSGTVILAGSVISAGVSIGENVIVNSMSLIDHDTVVGDHVHIAQGCVIGSNALIGSSLMLNLGEKVASFEKR